jgi:hypothetical protein
MGRKILARITAIIKAAANATTSSGLTLMPLVSSSKKRSNPALAEGIGADSRFLDFRLKTFTY